MSLDIIYNRPYQISEPENLQNIKLNYVYYTIKVMYPKKLISNTLLNHMRIFVPYTCECIYHLVYKCADKPIGVAVIYLDPLIKTNRPIKELEKDGYKFNKIAKLTISTYNSISEINHIFYRDYIPKSMFINKLFQLIDKDIENFKHWGCDFNCLEEPWKCKKNNPVTKYVCYKLYNI